MLPQEIFFLGLFHLFADPAADFFLDLENLHLAVDDICQQPETLLDVDRRQQLLLVLQFQGKMSQDQIAEPVGIFDGHDRDERFRRNLLAQLRPLLELTRQHPGLRFQFRRLLPSELVEFFDFDFEIRVFFHIPLDPGPVQALHQHAHRTAGQLQQLLDLGDRPRLIDVVGTRFVVLGVALRRQHDQAILHHDLLQRIDGLLAANIQMNDHIGKDQYPP